MESARLCLCARCRALFLVCSRCDRGQLYCAEGCSQVARRESVKAAGRRYQQGRDGRRHHAARQRRYRARQQKVTHQGSPPELPGDVLPTGSAVAAKRHVSCRPPTFATHYCHFCGGACEAHVRLGFLRIRRAPRLSSITTTKGADLGDIP
jgi:hypothetical protein